MRYCLISTASICEDAGEVCGRLEALFCMRDDGSYQNVALMLMP